MWVEYLAVSIATGTWDGTIANATRNSETCSVCRHSHSYFASSVKCYHTNCVVILLVYAQFRSVELTIWWNELWLSEMFQHYHPSSFPSIYGVICASAYLSYGSSYTHMVHSSLVDWGTRSKEPGNLADSSLISTVSRSPPTVWSLCLSDCSPETRRIAWPPLPPEGYVEWNWALPMPPPLLLWYWTSLPQLLPAKLNLHPHLYHFAC